jgi:hypothetical protein
VVGYLAMLPFGFVGGIAQIFGFLALVGGDFGFAADPVAGGRSVHVGLGWHLPPGLSPLQSAVPAPVAPTGLLHTLGMRRATADGTRRSALASRAS